MSEEQDDEEILELTEEMTAEEAKAKAVLQKGAPAAKGMNRPSSPFALLVDPNEAVVREARPSAPPEKPGKKSSRASTAVPVSSPSAVVARPIRELGKSSGGYAKRKGSRRAEEKVAEPQAEPAPAVEPEKAIEAEPAPAAEPVFEPEPAAAVPDAALGAAEDERGVAGEEDEGVLELGTELIVATPEEAPVAEVAPPDDGAAPVEVEAPVGAESPVEGAPPAEPAGEAETPAVEHAFDFGTPEMVFDAVDHAPDDAYEELDGAELHEEAEAAPEEIESEEIDLADAEDLTAPKTAPARPVKAIPDLPPGTRGKMKRRRKRTREWWMHIFDDDFMLLTREPSKWGQRREVDFLEQAMGVAPGSLVLDLACGMGQHAVAMAKRNYRVVGVDLSLSMLARAGELAQEAGQKINFIHGDMRDLGFDRTFDAVYCIGTSFGFFDEETNRKVLEGVHRALKPGAALLLDLVNRDFILGRQPNLTWFEGQDVVCMEETDFNYINSRLYVKRQLIVGGGVRQARHDFSLRLYSLHEIGQILHGVGFAVNHVSGHTATPGSFFGADSARMIIRAERRT
jgi:SAM-dependent methyltransferase